MLTLDGHSEMSADAVLLPCYQQKCVGKMPVKDSTRKAQSDREPTASPKAWRNVDTGSAEEVRGLPDIVVPEEKSSETLKCLPERLQKRHDQAVTKMQQELDYIGREMEASVLELQKNLQLNVTKSDKKSKLLFEKIMSDTALEGFSFEGLEKLWNMIHQESLNRKKWIRTMDESLKEIERRQVSKIADILKKCTVKLEEISFLAADVHKLINDEAMNINRALLGNRRATAKLLFNLMKSELEKEKSHQLKWQERVKDWKLIQKNRVIQSFREFMASEEIQNNSTVKTEMENMITGQIVLSERRLGILQHIGTLMPPMHTKSEINEWYRTLENLNQSLDTHSMECVKKLRIKYELVQGKCREKVQVCKMSLLDMNVCTVKDVELVHSDMLQMAEKLERRFEEELERMDRDFKEMAKQHEQRCQGLYSYFQEAMALWDFHKLQLSQQEGELQKKVDECRWEQDTIIQMRKADLDIVLEKMKMASCEEELKKYMEKALSSLDHIRTRNETLNQVVMDKVMAYPEAVLQELISYSTSISQHFNVKEIFRQNLQGKIALTVQDQSNTSMVQTGLEVRPHQHRAEWDNRLSQSVPEEIDSCQRSDGETNPAEHEEILAQETGETEEDGESIPHKSEETEHAEQGAVFNSSKAESAEIAMEKFSTASGNIYTVLGVEEAGKTDITENYFTKYEKEESLPMYLKYILLKEAMFVKLKKKIRLCFFEHLEKWFAESLSNSHVFVAAKKEELNSILLLHRQLHQQKQEEIQTNIYNVRAGELSLHKERLECHCAGLGEGLKKEKAEFLKFLDQLNNTNLGSQIRNLEFDFLHAPKTEQSASSSNNLQPQLHNHLESIGLTVRSYQHHLEEALGKLKCSNVDFLKTCRLFSEGGNFSSEEVKFFSRYLQNESKQIDSLESLIKTDVQKMESSCLEQATELIKQSEKKFADVSVSRAFMEKVQRSLRWLQQQIKSEVANSNLQSVTLKSYLEKLQQKRDACAHPTADEEEDFTTLAMDGMLQDSIAPAVQTESLRDKSKRMVMGLDPEKFPLLIPSRMDTSALHDLAISVIQNLAGFDPSKQSPDLNQEGNDHSRSLGPVKKKVSNAAQISKKSSWDEMKSKKSEKKSSKSIVKDKRYQLFEKKPPKSDTFKGIIMNILWTGSNTLLGLGEDFYGVKTAQMGIPKDLPETFEDWAEMLRQKLLSYKRQADDYYNFCLKEFQDQLKWFEEELSSVSQLAVDSLLKEHEQKLSSSTGQIQHLFNRQLEEWEKLKTVHQRKLHYSLGHPNNSLQLEALCQEEIKRQKAQTDGVHLNTKMLQDCAAECAQSFFSALAALTEELLLELDETITSGDIQVAETEITREKLSTLIHRKQAGLPLETSKVQQLIKQGRRTWPGIPKTTLHETPDYVLCRGTASVSTTRTTLGQLAVLDVRQAAYQKYKCKLEQLFAQIKEESAAQLLAIQRWEDWWEQSIQKIKQLYL
ncbi:coiled-coil domain-containing protein 180 isoform X2 [Empidonax traillii]|uniref:coiled-coil domain-containing protein 180 isoform X2 n=1 Tax=Empidonax traillii TaxID=164674 RepID=UPI000FFD8105|nr:coiled-coil domain-containing protein 180 isoform X2 [Empidonax traillii]